MTNADALQPAASANAQQARPRLAKGRGTSRWAWAILLAAAAWATHVHLRGPVLPFDDAFITFRYVDNLLAGKGLVYNEGQKVFGSTTPMYTLLLSAGKVITGMDTPTLAVRMNLLPYLACGLGVFLLLRRYLGNPLWAAAGAGLFLIDPILLAYSIGGMEPYVFLAFVLLALWVLSGRPRPVLVGALVGLATLTRPEGVLLAPLVVWIYRRWPRKILISAAVAMALGLPWVLFAFFYYGTPIPLSLIAKSKPVYPMPPGAAFLFIVSTLQNWVPAFLLMQAGRLGAVLVMGCLALASILVLLPSPYRRRRAFLPAAMFWLIIGFYSLGNPLMFEWYEPPYLALALVALVVALPAAAGLLRAGFERPLRRQLAPVAMVVSMVIGAALTLERYDILRGPDAPMALVQNNPTRLRILGYQKAAKRLNELVQPGQVVAAPEIGSLGYYFGGKVLDACGLVSPEALPFLPVPDNQRHDPTAGAIGLELVRSLEPAYVVTLPIFCGRSLTPSSWFNSRYVLVDKVPLPKPCWGDRHIMIYRNRNAAAR